MRRSSPFVLFLLFSLAVADLPSCYRARCSHCRIQFIAQMCHQTCANCPAGSFGKAVNNAGTTHIAAHGKPTVYRTAEHVQTLSQQDGQPQSAYVQQAQQPAQLPQAPTYQAPTPQQQQVVAQPAPTPGFQQPAANQFGQPAFNNQYSQPQFVQQPFSQPGQFSFPTAPTLPPPQAPQFSGFVQPAQGQQAAGQFPGFGQPTAPQQPGSMFNPFQPFLQQSYQAQQPQQAQTAYNPFTFPTLPPSATFAPFTPATVSLPTMGTFPTFPPFPTHAPLTQAPQPPVTQAPPPAANNYQQSQYNGQQQAGNNYVQAGQANAQVVEPQRPRQLYNTQQQTSAQQVQTPSFAGSQQLQTPYLQPARSNAIPTVQVGGGQPARSIDSAPVQLEKQAYIGKGETPAFVNQCPRQPNWEPCITKELANERFRNCCQRLGEGCSQLCNYDQSLTTLQLAVLTGRCPIGKVADMMICASGYEDATPCCQAYGVFEPGFEHCRPYCNPAAGLPSDGNLAEKYKCLGKLSQIQRCFYVTQKP